MIRTGIPATYWDSAPLAEVRTALALLTDSSDRGPSVGGPGTEVIISGGRS